MKKECLKIIFACAICHCLLFSNQVYATSSSADTNSNQTITSEETDTETSTETTEELIQKEQQEKLELYISAAKSDSVTLKWNKIKNAKKYIVYRSTKKKSGYKKIATVKSSKRTYKNKRLSEKKNYYYKIKAVLKNGKKLTSNIKVKVKVKGDYTRGSVYGPALSSSQLEKVKDQVANFVNVYTDPSMDDFLKVYAAHAYLCDTVSYETRGWHVNYANTAYGALKYKRAQCSGYARAFKALCDGMGIKCRYVHANNKAYNPSHQWNLVRVDKKWYLIDVQGNDSSSYWFAFLIGKNTIKQMGNIYKYDTKGMPSLAKKDYDFSKYVEDSLH